MADSAACFTLISPGVLSSTNETPAPLSELKSALESPNDSVKIETMKRILVMMVNGEPLPGLLMHVIRFVMPSKSKPLKKLLLVYWEVCPKYNGDKLKQEMILVWCVPNISIYEVWVGGGGWRRAKSMRGGGEGRRRPPAPPAPPQKSI